MADPMRVIERPVSHEGVKRFLHDYREHVDAVEGRTVYRPIPKQLIYRPETEHVAGCLLALCDNGKIYEMLDGSTVWNEVEGP